MIALRRATRVDGEGMAELLRQTDRHYGNPVKDEAGYERVLKDVLDSGFSETVIAWEGETPLGYALYTFLQPTDSVGAQMFMKELFVSGAARGRGIGRLLMRRMGEIAVDRGCLRLDWTADGDNARGIAFYQGLGARPIEERLYFRVTDFESFLANLSDE